MGCFVFELFDKWLFKKERALYECGGLLVFSLKENEKRLQVEISIYVRVAIQ